MVFTAIIFRRRYQSEHRPAADRKCPRRHRERLPASRARKCPASPDWPGPHRRRSHWKGQHARGYRDASRRCGRVEPCRRSEAPRCCLEPLAHAISQQQAAAREDRRIHESPKTPIALDLAGERFHLVTSVASAPNCGDIRAHTRPRDNVYLDLIFFE